jgi:UDP-N-acetylglucosamine--N-acetylmuramyl-(pentapeptide) pyrophosphoryl-undecaprenol N-acetylglucosamine transferase
MAGGGTGGHVIPAVAVARELKNRGHRPIFVGTRNGFEAKLVPSAGFELEFIEIGGLKRVGILQTLRTLAQLPGSIAKSFDLISQHHPSAIFSMGGYAAGPVTVAGWFNYAPIVIMEPNAVPGLANRIMGRFAGRALVSFPETQRFFPAGRSEITGLPVRAEFSNLNPKPESDRLTILVTGGSRGSRTLNNATRECWPHLHDAPFHVRLIHQTGTDAYESIAKDFANAGLEGEVVPFISDMPAAFAQADLIVCRSGAGAVAELAAAGKPSILVPFPFAADDHQLRNAEAFAKAGAARLVLDREMTGQRLFEEVNRLAANPTELEQMGANARTFAHPNAAQRAADVLEEISASKGRASHV